MTKFLSLASVMRVRRHQPTRLEGFVDASFAFALTLVVISIGHMPGSVEEMLAALRGMPAFAACFLMLARIWLSHRDWSRHYDIDDTVGMVLSLSLVFLVLVYVFPLRMLFIHMFVALSGGWLDDGTIVAIKTLDELRAAYVVFGIGLASISVVFVSLYRHALRCADAIGLGAGEVLVTRMISSIWIGQAVVALLSIILAQVMSRQYVLSLAAPGMIYLINTIIGRSLRSRCRKAIVQLPVSSSPGNGP